MNIYHALILGLVEGLTEFLPVSSTFHLIVSAKMLGLSSSDFLKLFEVVIQSGAIFALLFIYAKTLLADRKLFLNVIYSFIPTALVGFGLHKIIKEVFFESNWLMLSVFILTGLIFLLIDLYALNLKKTCSQVSRRDAIIIGFSQAVSVVPGVSRAGSVIVAMMLMGYKRDEAAKYTFLLSLPTIFAATALDLFQSRALLLSQTGGYGLLAVGALTSLVVGYLVMRWFTTYLANHTLSIFGWYRLAVASLLVIFKVLP